MAVAGSTKAHLIVVTPPSCAPGTAAKRLSKLLRRPNLKSLTLAKHATAVLARRRPEGSGLWGNPPT